MADYVCNHASLQNSDSFLSHLINFNELSNAHKCFIAHNSPHIEPHTYLEALQSAQWVSAMDKELSALQENNTWELVDLPKGKKAVGCKWVYKIKQHADGSIERYKARLVAKGYTQKEGIDYEETFSPVIKMTTVRCIISLAASNHWDLFQLDVNNAFLHGNLHEEVYMKIPDGLKNTQGKVCLLKKSIYGLKQASRQWFAKLVSELISQGFKQSKNDYSLFTKDQNGSFTIAAVYVDDIILTGNNLIVITQLKAHLNRVFSIKDLGKLHYFLGIEVGYLPRGIALTQHKFTAELLQSSKLQNYKPTVTPLPQNLKLHQDEGDLYNDAHYYRTIVGKLNFLTHTRPDLAYTVQHLSQFMQNPRIPHIEALHHTLRYISGTTGHGILMTGSTKINLQAYSDSDWASCPNTRRSVTGYVILLGPSPISWKSKKQSTVSKSSSEAEYRAISSAASEVTWVVRLLNELKVTDLEPVTLFCDNQSAIHIAKNPIFHERTKHIEVDCHFTRDKVLEGLLQPSYLPTASQIADIMTKILPSQQHNNLISKLGMLSTPSLRGVLRIPTMTLHASLKMQS